MERTKKTNRRYYLHRKIKGCTRVLAARKTIYLNYEQHAQVSTRQLAYMHELRDKYQYAIQLEL